MYSIAIDGPAGAGKSTIAKKLAKNLSFVYVDTGAMYRAIALYFLRNKIDPEDVQGVLDASKNLVVSLEYQDGEQQVLLDGECVNAFIRTEEVGNMASLVAAKKEVRAALFDLQRNMAKTQNIVMDGRDIGTNVLPDASLKIYLTASSAVRAKRRYDELREKGIACSFDEIEKDIIERDYQDMHREIAPLRQAEDAVYLDSSNLAIEQVVEAIKQEFQRVK